MSGWLLRTGMFVLLALGTLPVRAVDPLAMFLIGIARDMVINYANTPRQRPEEPMPDLKLVYPGTTVEPEVLRRLIDDSFTYLSESQRGEIFDRLHTALMDPKNAAVRGPMIEYFAERALLIRAAQRKLAGLSEPEKRRIAKEFRTAYEALSPEDQKQLGEVVRLGLLPVPYDLGELLAAEIAR